MMEDINMSHFIEKCKHCNCVITQCRCASTNKEIRWGVCEQCSGKIVKEAIGEEVKLPLFCAWCKKHSTQWNPPAETPMSGYGESSHGICPECLRNWQTEFEIEKKKRLVPGIRSESVMSFEEFIKNKLREIYNGKSENN